MADRKGATGEKSYRSRNRAISALVQNTTNKNIVTTDLSGGTDSASIITLIQSANDSDRTAGSVNSVHRITSLSQLNTLATHTGLGVLNGEAKVGDLAIQVNPHRNYVLTNIAAAAVYINTGFHVQTNNGPVTRLHFDVVPTGQLPSQNFAVGSAIASNINGADARTVTGVSDTGGNYSKGYLDFTPSDAGYPPSWDNETVWVSTSVQTTWQPFSFDSGEVKALIDSSFINARVNPFDSSHVVNLVDSAYIALRDRFQDSSGIISIVDSAYVTARAGGGVDSAATLALINSRISDSAVSTAFTYNYTATAGQTLFVGNDNSGNSLRYNAGAIQAFQNGVLLVDTVDYTATSGTSFTLNSGATVGDNISITKFTGVANSGTLSHTQFKYISATPATTFSGADVNNKTLSYNSGEVQVYLNGLLLVDSDDYVAANGTSVVLTSATDSGDVVNISKFVQGDGGMAFRSTNFVYTTGSPTTTIAGSDDNNLTLSYINDQIQVFRNGILLIDSADYTATNGTSVILNQATNAADTVAITAFRGVLTGGLDSANITNLVDASYVQARQSAAGLDSAKTVNLIDSAYVQAREAPAGGLDSAAVIALSPTNSTSRSASSNPILTIEAGTTLQHSGWTDSAGTNSPPYVNAAQIRKGGLVQVGSNLTGSQAVQSLRERQQYMYQNCFYVAPSANTGIDILRYTMLDVADDAVPSNSEVYGRVNWICWAGGHTNATGNGSTHIIGTIDYNGASPSNGTSHQHADGNGPSFAWNHSNFVSTLNIQGSGNSGNVGYFTVFVQILFTHGAGARGSSIYYKLEELV